MRIPNKYGRGFTLIELLVVISIIGLLASVVLASLNSARTKSKAASAASDLKQINQALNLYVSDHGGYPCFDHVWDDARETQWSAPYMKWPKTPYNTNFHFEHLAWGAGLTYSMSLQSVPLKDAQALADAINGGNLNSGILRINGGTDPVRLEWLGVDQSLPVPNPEQCP